VPCANCAKNLKCSPRSEKFWTDAHIAKQTLAAHLNPQIDAASRRPETIQRSTSWIMQTLNLQPGDSLLDLGCGPGLWGDLAGAHYEPDSEWIGIVASKTQHHVNLALHVFHSCPKRF
jgi:cyclopropane fatty-acyl-phospholipid synthase-like methyltransferase